MAQFAEAMLTGVYTKTVVRSPVIRWMLHARIRNQRFNDVVFVGDNFIQVKQVIAQGRLQDIASKHDFDAQIRAAAVFSNEEDDFLARVKTEHDATYLDDDSPPPQSIVLTLDTNYLVFLFLRTDSTTGQQRFVHQIIPIASYDQILFQPGEHLAVDHMSRAIAIAANEREVIVFSAKPQEQIKEELQQKEPDWVPITTQRNFEVTGVIQHIDFLVPREDDSDHVILLLIVIDQRRTKAVWFDWYISSDPRDVHVHPGQSLSVASNVPSLLIPLRDAAFLLVTGNEMTIWSNLLSGAATDRTLNPTCEPPMYPGVSGHSPTWASWTKAPRTKTARQQKDHIYLAREDGRVYLLVIEKSTGIHLSSAGHFTCHVGSAFASLGDEGDPELLGVAGETSGGQVVRIGFWPSERTQADLPREVGMHMVPVEFLPNWASVTDMIAAEPLQTSRGHNKDDGTTLITSGRQPYGTITELRNGIVARLAAFIPISGLRTVTDIWALPDLMGNIALVMSSPSATRVIHIPHECDDYEDCGDSSAFGTSERTLSAGIANEQLIQVTTGGICATSTLKGNFEDTMTKVFGEGISAITATIIPESSLVLAVEQQRGNNHIVSWSIPSPDDDSDIERNLLAGLPGSPVCLEATQLLEGVFVVTSDTGGSITAMLFRGSGPPTTHIVSLPVSTDKSATCDHMVILRAPDDRSRLMLVCGLRDGRIVSFIVNQHTESLLNDEHVIDLGYSTVKLVQLASNRSTACAMTGISTFLLCWDGQSSRSLLAENIWLADMTDPDLAQTSIVSCSQVPSSEYLASETLEKSVMMVSGDSVLVASLDSTSTTVPRQTKVSGTPNRLIYAETLRCIVCASVRTEVRSFPSSKIHAPPEERRQTWPTLDFIPSKDTIQPYTYNMQPGERVYTLLEWSISQTGEKKHTFILVGGEYVRTNGSRRGRVTFLQPVSRNWEVTSVRESRQVVFDDPVYSMALFDPTTYIACSGEHVYLYRLSRAEMRWDELCDPFRLNSRGVHVTVHTDHSNRRVIVVSTQRDSLVTLRLEENDTGCELLPVSMAPRPHSSLNHLVLPPTAAPYSTMDVDQFALLTTRDCHLIGLASPKAPEENNMQYTSAEIAFDAELPACLTRLACTELAARKGPPPDGVSYRITACTTDGALYGVLLIEKKLWRRLFWLQRLVEWSEELSPHSCHDTAYEYMLDDERQTKRQRDFPVGFGGDIYKVLYTSTGRASDMHIDADVLKRVLQDDGREAIKKVLREVASKSDSIGGWLREHMDTELSALEAVLALVRQLDEWA